MKTFHTSIQVLFLLLFTSGAIAQGCYPDPQFAGQPAGIYPIGPMQMDCSGLSASKSVTLRTDTSFQLIPIIPDTFYMFFDSARVDSVAGLPLGLWLETDVMNTATPASPYGAWAYSGSTFNQVPPVGCISIVGASSDWMSASTGGTNSDGVYDIEVYIGEHIDTTDAPPVTDEWTGQGIVPHKVFYFQLRVNESACNGDISVSAATTGDNPNTTECEGTVNVDVYYGTPPYTYSYSNGATGSSVDSLCAGLYTVNVTDANGASGSHQFAIASDANIYSNPGNPPAWVDSLFYATSNCSLDYNLPIDSFMISNAYTIGNDTCFVEWVVYQGGASFTLGSFYPFIGFNPTVFSFTLYCQNGRAETGVIQLYEYLDLSEMSGVQHASGINGFSIFPNPSSGEFNLQVGSPEKLQLEIYDVAGKLLEQQQLSGATNYGINLPDVPTGTYLLKVNSAEGIEIKKLLKQ